MSVINVLDKRIYTQIAAGEVVERPSSVIKELVENSIDAGATEIKINIFGGGKDAIEVFDNGSGIYKDDLTKTILPHATSKIADVNDLYNIKTLGFRGEALSSIASVSKLKITSKRVEYDIGYTMECQGGENIEIYEAPSNNGTYVTVTNLFFNTPARQKFLKSDRSEENDVTDTVTRLILANPTVAFSYSVNDQPVFTTFGDGMEDAVVSLYGKDFLKQTFSISNYLHGVKIDGYVGKINYTKPNRSYQTVILNGRCVQNQTIQSAIMNAYSGYLMKRRYPMAVLYITVPSEIVDVNVTPNKSDVRFIDNSVIYGAIYSTVSKVLDGTDSALDIIRSDVPKYVRAPEVLREMAKNEVLEEITLVTSKGNDKPNTSNYKFDKFDKDIFSSFTILKEDKDVYADKSQCAEDIKTDDVFLANKRYIEELEAKSLEQASIDNKPKLKYVGQALNTYLIFEHGSELVLVDQHAAHERLLYNKLLYQHTTKQIATQPLLVPYTITLNTVEEEYIQQKMPFIKELGLDVELIAGKLSVYEIPLDLVGLDINNFFEDVLCDYTLKRETIPEIIKEKLMQKACKSAVKAGMELSEMEVEALVALLDGNINLKCPHGRPIAVKISRQEIDKWFKRIV